MPPIAVRAAAPRGVPVLQGMLFLLDRRQGGVGEVTPPA